VIVVDTSALMAIALDEPQAEACIAAIEREDEIVISAGTLAEALIVSARRNLRMEMARAIDRLAPTIVPVTAGAAQQIGEVYEHWGKGLHPAGLNFGDCFAYQAAKECGCPLLYLGDDFSKTDIESAL
jgi:ribonuclease VapC